MTMTIPTIPTMPAGYIATAADMNNLAYAVQFLLNKPIARAVDTAGTQAVTITDTAVTFGAASFDTDGMWNIGTPTRLTVATPGFYKMDYCVQAAVASGTSINMNTRLTITTGANNPAGAGVATQIYAGYGGGSSAGGLRAAGHASGILPFYMYVADYISVSVIAASAGSTLSISAFPSYMSLELVGI
jgi:hypothetical protein